MCVCVLLEVELLNHRMLNSSSDLRTVLLFLKYFKTR